MASGDSPHNSNRVTVAIFLLALSACYAVIVEAWSAPILFMDSRGATFVAGLIAGILIFYAVYGWLIYQVWKRAAWAKWALLVLIASAYLSMSGWRLAAWASYSGRSG